MNAQQVLQQNKRNTLALLIILLSLFIFRVLAQLIQYRRNLPVLPGFEDWHSATLPYGWLLLCQAVIIVTVLLVISRIYKETYKPYRRRALFLLTAGLVYFLIMLVRLILGVSIMKTHPWMGAILPTIFHLVLAGIVLTIGRYEYRNYRTES